MMKWLEQRFNTGNLGEYPKIIQQLIQLHLYHCQMRYWKQPSPKIFFLLDLAQTSAHEEFLEHYSPGYGSLMVQEAQDDELRQLLSKADTPKRSIIATTEKSKPIEINTNPLLIHWDEIYVDEVTRCLSAWFRQDELIGVERSAPSQL
tara:strand:+ start:2567 stop:3010 length:444 start_codon:yes stop_codon:yes gene_type:complete